MRSRIAPQTKRVIAKLTALFSLDAFGGGVLTDALVAYWFFRRFGVAEHELGLVFFAVHILNACSHVGAAWLARRIGLVNTMVFTHLPSSLFLMAVPFAPSVKWAVLLFLCREALVEMDVPTRQSYVAALVKPSERTFASGITNLARNLFWAIGSGLRHRGPLPVNRSRETLRSSWSKFYDQWVRTLSCQRVAFQPKTPTRPATMHRRFTITRSLRGS